MPSTARTAASSTATSTVTSATPDADHPAVAGLELRPLTFPTTLEDTDPHAADFLAMVDVRNEIHRVISGHDDHCFPAAELLPHYAPQPWEIRRMWLVLLDGVPVGRVGVDLPLEGAQTLALFFIDLHPDVWGRGIGTTALDLVERTAREHGRTMLQTYVEHPEVPGPRLPAPTGFGSVPAEASNVRFLLKHGFVLEQIERNSVLDLTAPADGVERLLAQARERSADYRTVSWFAPTPPEHVAGYAWLKSRMATDVPAAELEVPEEVWDAERIAVHDERYTSVGRILHVVAAQHIATGELCGFNELVIGVDRTGASHQEDTLVLKEHRGHRLGMLVKCENLLRWREIAPDSPRVMTYNAEENRPMLDINEELGFVPIAYEGAWQKQLD